MSNKNTIWYIQAGRMEGGKFRPERQMSAVLISLERFARPDDPDDHREVINLLLTVQHGIRTFADPQSNHYEGPYWDEYRGWYPDTNLTAPGDAIELEIYDPLTSHPSTEFSDATDFAFLAFKSSEDHGWPAARPCLDESYLNVDKATIIFGYSGGSLISEFLGNVVTPSEYRDWRYRSLIPSSQVGVLTDGNTAPTAGASGGGVFCDGCLVGVYRGTFKTEQLFMPIHQVQRHCRSVKAPHSLLLSGPGREDSNSILRFMKDNGLLYGIAALGLCSLCLPEWWIHASRLWLGLAVVGFLPALAALFLPQALPIRRSIRWQLFYGVSAGLLLAVLCIWMVSCFTRKLVVELNQPDGRPVGEVRYATSLPDFGVLNTTKYDGHLYLGEGRIVMIMGWELFSSITAFEMHLMSPADSRRCFKDHIEEVPRSTTLRATITYREHN